MSEDKRNQEIEQANTDSLKDEERRPIDLGANLKKEVKTRKKLSSKGRILCALGAVVALAALVLVLRFALNSGQPELPETTESTTVQLLEGEEGKLVSIDFAGENNYTVSLEGEDSYQVTGMDADDLNMELCEGLFLSFSQLKADDTVEENPTDLSKYGLDDPAARLTLHFEGGNSRTFLLGDVVPTSVQRYLMEENGSAVYLLNSYNSGKILAPSSDYHKFALPAVDGENGKELSIQKRGEEPWRIQMGVGVGGGTINPWKIYEPVQIDADGTKINEFTTSLAGVTLQKYVFTAASEAELAQYGLDDPLAVIDYEDQNNAAIHLAIGNDNGEGSYYARIDDSLDVYLTSVSGLKFVQEIDLIHLIDRYSNMVNIANVDTVTIQQNGQQYVMHIDRKEVPAEDEDSEPTTEETFTLNGKVVEEKAFKTAYQALISINNTGIVQEDKVGSAPVLSVLYHLNNGNEDILYEFLPYDINNYAIRANGQTVVYGRKDAVDRIWPALKSLEDGTILDEKD